MQAFSYQRRDDVASAVAAGQQAGARYIGGGTNLLDLMKGGVEKPTTLVDVSQLPLADDRRVGRRRRDDRRAGPQQRRGRPSAVRTRYPLLTQALVSGASGPAAQHGDGRRQPAATDALLLLRRSGLHDVQQAHPGFGLRRDRRPQPHPRDPRRERRLHRGQPVRHERRAGRARRDRPRRSVRAASAASRSATSIDCRAARRSATRRSSPAS